MGSSAEDEGSLADGTPSAVYASWILRLEAGGEQDFEALCRAHPELAGELRRLHRQHLEIDELFLRFGLAGNLTERLGSRYGSGVDPKVELEAEEKGDFTARVLGRLSGRAGASSRYRLKGQVAEGGMGAILRVWDEDLRRHLAMKVILGRREAPSAATPPVDRRQLARFLEEAQVTGQLDHPGIVPVHELGLDSQGRAYFTMKLVKGRDLKAIFDLVRDGKEGWSEVRALGVLLKVCEAMSYAHDKGVIHRDLKPANIMVGRYGEVYVMDWGLARILGREETRDIRLRPESASSGPTVIRSDRREHASDTPDSPLYTMDGDVVGTPAYMPPEQANGDLDAMGPPSDVYAVGAMLYHLLAGHMPYVRPGEKASNYMVLRWVKDGPPISLAREAPGAPAELVAIADKAMAREPRERYPDMTALARDLSAFVEGRVVAAYETGAVAEAKKWIRRNRALASSLAAAVLILLAGIATSLIYAGKANEEAARADREARDAALLAQNEVELRRVADQLRDQALDRERELRIRGLIQDLAAFDAAGQSYDYASRQSEPARIWWPRAARLLLEGQEEDPGRGISWRPGLADAEQRLAELRSRALEYTAADEESDRSTHPRAAELERKRAELLWHRRMLGMEAWHELAEVAVEMTREELAGDANELNAQAWKLVDPDAPVFGEEIRALSLATRAASLASDEERAMILDTLAWAQYRCGRFDEARATMGRAVEAAPSERREECEGYQLRLEAAIAAWRDGEGQAIVASLDSEVAALEAIFAERRTWRFAASDEEWWHKQLAALIGELQRLKQRLAFVHRSVEAPEAVVLWDAAIAAIEAHPKYGGRRLSPQIGLLPIGADPVSGLWEFAHLQTGEPPRRGEDGKLELTADTGLVFVLLPGGRFWVGAQDTDPEGRHYDPQPHDNESPVHEVELSPFFLSKYEMAQGPWRRIATWAPSNWNEDGLEPAHSVSWDDCVAALARADAWITLCTEAQWEYACRGGKDTPWWTGPEAESLRGKENVTLDEESRSLQPIGCFAPNPFGLHDMHGNLWEWCLDGAWRSYGSELRVDPLHPWEGAVERVIRGGLPWSVPARARSSHRNANAPGYRIAVFGLRPARRITP